MLSCVEHEKSFITSGQEHWGHPPNVISGHTESMKKAWIEQTAQTGMGENFQD